MSLLTSLQPSGINLGSTQLVDEWMRQRVTAYLMSSYSRSRTALQQTFKMAQSSPAEYGTEVFAQDQSYFQVFWWASPQILPHTAYALRLSS